MRLKIFGTGTSGHQVVTATLKKYLEMANIDYKIEEETNVDEFLNQKITSVPAVQINDEVPISVSLDNDFNRSLRSVVKKVLSLENYGDIRKIITPIDFSDTSTNAFYFGQRIAQEINAIVKVIHIYIPSSADLDGNMQVDPNQRIQRENALKEFVDEADQDWNSDIMQAPIVESEFRMGFPGDEILKSAEENIPALIVMGTQGNSGILKRLFGSVSTKVLSDAKCPVLLIPENARFKRINNIMYATEDLQLDIDCIDQVIELARPFDAKIHLIRVSDGKKKEISEEHKQRLTRQFPFTRFSFETIHGDNVIDSMNKYAEVNKIDMQVFCHKKRTFFDDLFHKSISVEMSIYTDVPILIVHPPKQS